MFANFKSGNQQILVPLNWVRNFNLQSFLNYGPVAKQTQLVFYSNDKARAPNFDLPPSNPNAFWYNLDNGYDACYNGRVESIFENENKSLEAAVDRRIIKLEKVVSYQYNSIKMMHIDLEGIVIDLDTLHDAQIILDEEFDQIVGEDTAAMVNENQNIDAEQEEVVQFLAQIGEEAAAVMVNESHASDAEQEVQLLAKIGEETAPAMVDENYDANTEQASEQAVQMANHNQMSLNGPIDSFSGGLHYEENRTHRIFTQFGAAVSKFLIKKLAQLNENLMHSGSILYDFRFLKLLLRELFTLSEISATENALIGPKIDFIQSVFDIRVELNNTNKEIRKNRFDITVLDARVRRNAIF